MGVEEVGGRVFEGEIKSIAPKISNENRFSRNQWEILIKDSRSESEIRIMVASPSKIFRKNYAKMLNEKIYFSFNGEWKWHGMAGFRYHKKIPANSKLSPWPKKKTN